MDISCEHPSQQEKQTAGCPDAVYFDLLVRSSVSSNIHHTDKKETHISRQTKTFTLYTTSQQHHTDCDDDKLFSISLYMKKKKSTITIFRFLLTYFIIYTSQMNAFSGSVLFWTAWKSIIITIKLKSIALI